MIIPFQKHRFLACLVEPMRARFRQRLVLPMGSDALAKEERLRLSFLANLVNSLPFAKASLPWLVPAVVGILLSLVLPNKQESDVFEME